MEIVVGDDDLRTILGDHLRSIAPAARGLDGGLHGFCAGVHRQRHIQAGDAHQTFKEGPEPLGMVRPARDG
jgi:hypothetical protein